MKQPNAMARYSMLLGALFPILLLAGCMMSAPPSTASTVTAEEAADAEVLPRLTAIELADGARLQVVATTNIVADVVAQVGGDQIDLVPLIPTGADPHSFTTTPQDLIALNQAQVIFINGLQLEESLMPVLESLDNAAPIVSVNVGVETEEFGHAEEEAAEAHDHEAAEADEEEGHHHHTGVDPHTWFNVHAVEQWVNNIEQVLSTLDPANAATYAANADAYRGELTALATELDAMVAELPVEQRKLVTDHEALGYFADAYDFTIIGAVIPALSTMASPSANELATLQDQIEAESVPAIFVGTTVSPDLAEQVAADTGAIVAAVYTGSLSAADGPVPTYLDLMRYNMYTIVEALK